MGLTGRRGQEASRAIDENAMQLGKCPCFTGQLFEKKNPSMRS